MSSKLIKEIKPSDNSSWLNHFFVTLDLDWAIDEVIDYSLNIMNEQKCKSTLFVTHESELIKSLKNNKRIELGIHPNFNYLFNGDNRYGKNIDEVVKYYLNIVPDAKSVRSHSLAKSSPILRSFGRHGLEFDCNTFIPFLSNDTLLEPFASWYHNMVVVPHFWEDDVNILHYKQKFSSNFFDKNLGIKVFDFHPIHIFLNTFSYEHYNKAKSHYKDFEMLKKFVNNKEYGVRDYFIELINFINEK